MLQLFCTLRLSIRSTQTRALYLVMASYRIDVRLKDDYILRYGPPFLEGFGMAFSQSENILHTGHGGFLRLNYNPLQGTSTSQRTPSARREQTSSREWSSKYFMSMSRVWKCSFKSNFSAGTSSPVGIVLLLVCWVWEN